MHYSFAELAGMIDHSLLHPTLTDAELEQGALWRTILAARIGNICGDRNLRTCGNGASKQGLSFSAPQKPSQSLDRVLPAPGSWLIAASPPRGRAFIFST